MASHGSNIPALYPIYEVTYPDERLGPDGKSKALFRNPQSAHTFAGGNGGVVDFKEVTYRELRKLISERKLERGY